jgi:hypothetical protein
VQRKRDAILSVLLSSLTSFALLLLLLALRSGVGHWSAGGSSIRIVSEQPERSEEYEKPERIESYRLPSRPSKMESERTRMIEALAIGKYSIPKFSAHVESMGWFEKMLEDDNDFGWGVGAEGMGEAGGTFFGIERHASRFVFVLDFSSSMEDGWDGEENAGERSRIGSLRREVVRSIKALPLQAQFAVIFFHDEHWTLDDPGPVSNRGSGGRVDWKLATQRNKFAAIESITSAQTGGGTYWVKPLLEGLQMSPKPQVLYLLSDGEPTDWDEMKREFVTIKMCGVAIDTIALESEDEGAGRLKALARKTGGSYRRIQRGQVIESVESSLHRFRSAVRDVP